MDKRPTEEERLKRQIDELQKELAYIRSLRAFKWADTYYRFKDEAYLFRHYLKRSYAVWREEGVKALVRKTKRKARRLVGTKRSQRVSRELERTYRECLIRYQEGTIKGVVIIPSGFPFDEVYNQRTILLAKHMAKRGYGVLYMPWQWEENDPVDRAYEEVHPSVFQVKMMDVIAGMESLDTLGPSMEKHFITTFPAPVFFELYSALRENGFSIVYDIMDEWEAFRLVGQAAWYDRQIEEAVVLASDAVTCVSAPLQAKFRHLREDITVVGNGYDPLFLKKGNVACRERGDDCLIRVGYVGHLTDAWVEWERIFELLRLPEFHVTIIGYGASESILEELKRYPNATYLGKVHPSDLHHHVARWHVGLIPFKEGPLAEAVDPIKVYEYIHFGLPTIVTGIHHLAHYPGCSVVQIGESLSDAVRHTYERVTKGERVVQADEWLADATWERRLDQVLGQCHHQTGIGGLYHE